MPVLAFILRRIAAWLEGRRPPAVLLSRIGIDPHPDILATLQINYTGRWEWRITRRAHVYEAGRTIDLAHGYGYSAEAVKEQITATWNSLRPNMPITSLELE